MIHLVDTIGVHSGAHFYDLAFKQQVNQAGGSLVIVSNFTGQGAIALFPNFYTGGIHHKLWKISIAYLRWLIYLLRAGRNDWFVYQSFGLRIVDLLFIFPLLIRGRYFLDIHDLYTVQGEKQSKFVANVFYRIFLQKAIVHSERAGEELTSTGFRGYLLYSPHFHYSFDKSYDKENVAKEVLQSVSKDSFNILFFGVIRASKRLDLFIEALALLDYKRVPNLNIIIAGKDKDFICQKCLKNQNIKFPVNTINRRIEEEEMNFLFDSCSMIVMPYENIYQSGVLESSIYFRLPVICSNQPAFQNVLTRYTSFGRIFSPLRATALANVIEKSILDLRNNTWHPYSDADLNAFYRAEEIKRFVAELLTITRENDIIE